jgi:hypothetical protein
MRKMGKLTFVEAHSVMHLPRGELDLHARQWRLPPLAYLDDWLRKMLTESARWK